ncbi:Tip elongation aberrant protein 1 [Leucoagaricus sp. SymC.cos]|nr:Tip elongation aberrant protein 1 [Leucoagaricus sp. SymC.cos]
MHPHPGLLYYYSAKDNTASVLQCIGDDPGGRQKLAMAMIGTSALAIQGGTTCEGGIDIDPSLFLLNLVSCKWSRIRTSGYAPGHRIGHSMAVVGTTIFMFGGLARSRQGNWVATNELWAFDLKTIRTQPRWELIAHTSDDQPSPRQNLVLVPYKDRLILFGGCDQDKKFATSDVWYFDTSHRQWHRLQCTGVVPPSLTGLAGSVLDDVLYVFGVSCSGDGVSNDVFALKIPRHKWFSPSSAGKAGGFVPHSHHAIARIGTKIFIFGGRVGSPGAPVEAIVVFDAKYVNNPSIHTPERIMELEIDFRVNLQVGEVRRRLAGLDRDDKDVKRREIIAAIFESLSRANSLSDLRGIAAQTVVDFLAEALESRELLQSDDHRRRVLRLLRKIAKSAQVFPRRTELRGVQCDLTDRVNAVGGYGEIYKGVFEGQKVCVKAVRISESGPNQRILRAHAGELALLAYISHPNVIPLYGAFLSSERNPRICIVSPWMENGDLVYYLKNFPDTSRIPLMSDVAAGLQYLHDMSIIYADLKAASHFRNVLVSLSQRALLTDFGVSTVLSTNVGVSTAGDFSGTAYWMAPELLIQDELPPPTPQSDMWGFGCLCFEALTGDIPFAGHYDPPQLIAAFMRGQATPLRPKRNSAPTIVNGGPLVALAERCWSYDTNQRPTAAEALQVLTGLNVDDDRPSMDEALATFEAGKSGRGEPKIDYRYLLSIVRKKLTQIGSQIRVGRVMRANAELERRLAELELDKDEVVRRLEELEEGKREARRRELVAAILNSMPQVKSLADLQSVDAQTLVDFLTEVLESRCNLSDPFNSVGGYGLIFKGTLDGQTVCVKAVRVDGSGPVPEKIMRAQAGELALLGHVSHPNVIPLYGAYLSAERNPRICMVSPWMENGDLVDFLHKHPNTPRIPLMSDVAAGLQFLHSMGIVHADLKARNVLVSRSLRAILADFGVSTICNTSVGSSTAADFSGTAYWMAPELLTAAELPPPTPSSDMWGFGCICFEAITGETPFLEYYRYPIQLVGAFMRGGVTPLRPKRNGPPTTADGGPLMVLAEKCWDYEPDKRLTAAEAVQSLSELNVEDKRPSMDEELAMFEAVKSKRVVVKIDYRNLLFIVQKSSWLTFVDQKSAVNATTKEAQRMIPENV